MANTLKPEEHKPSKIPANDARSLVWKTCPICERGDAKSPEFKDFLPRIRHLIEHKTGFPVVGVPIEVGDGDEICKHLGVEKSRAPSSRDRKKILIKEARPFLPSVAEWLEEALTSLPELALIREPGILTSEKLCRLVRSLSTDFQEQREFMVNNENILRETGQDAKWPPKLEAQAKFLAESMAGADFGLAPSSSREYIRQQKVRVRPARDKRKSFERRSRSQDGHVRTNKSYE